MAHLPPGTEGRSVEWRIEPLPEVDRDPALLKLVFSNLLSNAAKFTPTRQPAEIETSTREATGATVFFVRDNGVGFDPKYADKLFGVFQRLHRQEDFEEAGVGLATVQRIIHKHGGETWAESERGRGATFFFTLARWPEQRPPGGAGEVNLGRF
jgi:two-component system, chemotaxis family, sensor kinase Cph1